jgi:hypothetical protein
MSNNANQTWEDDLAEEARWRKSANERAALAWLNDVDNLMTWNDREDSEGTPEQRLQSAWINTMDTYAEGVITIVEQPAYLRSHACILDDPMALAMLPAMPVYE